MPSHACHHHTNIILAMWCPITGSYKNWPHATAEDDAPRAGGGAAFYFSHLIWFYSFFLQGRLKGSPGQDGVKGGDNDVCPPSEGHANNHVRAHMHILNRRPAVFFFFFFFFITGKVSQWCSNPRTKTTVTTVLLAGLCRTIRWEWRVTAVVFQDSTHTHTHTSTQHRWGHRVNWSRRVMQNPIFKEMRNILAFFFFAKS